jgi:hypothetical protein
MKGKVINSLTKEPIKNVNVFVANAGIGTTTDAQGLFQLFGNLVPSTKVNFTHIGFEKLTTNYDKAFTIVELNPTNYSLPIVDIKPKETVLTNLALLVSGFFLLSSTLFKKTK